MICKEMNAPTVNGSNSCDCEEFDGKFASILMRTRDKDSTRSTLATVVTNVSMTRGEQSTNLSMSESQASNSKSRSKSVDRPLRLRVDDLASQI